MINVTKTYLPDCDKFNSYIKEIYKSGWLTNNGSLVQLLEKRLQNYLGVRNLILVANGTLALQIAYKLLKLEGEVITTPFSFVATSSSLVWDRLCPIYSAIDKETFNLAPIFLEEKITAKTSAILPVHIFGNPCAVESIAAMAKQYELKIIYDAAQAFAVKCNGTSVLNYGDISILSLHATKIFHAVEGGALIIHNDDLYQQAKKMINFGITGPEKIECLGINAKMSELHAAMGLCVFDDIDKIIAEYKERYLTYKRALAGYFHCQKIPEQCEINYSYFPILFDDSAVLVKKMKKLKQYGIDARRYFYPSLDCLPYINNQEILSARDIASRILCLPLSAGIEFEIIELIVSILLERS